jgi:hypothetical protein
MAHICAPFFDVASDGDSGGDGGVSCPLPCPVLKTYLGNLLYSPPDFTLESQQLPVAPGAGAAAPSSSSPSSSSAGRAVVGQVDMHEVWGRDYGALPLSAIQRINLQPPDAAKGTGTPRGLALVLSCRQRQLLGRYATHRPAAEPHCSFKSLTRTTHTPSPFTSVPSGLHVDTASGRKVLSYLIPI